MDAFDTLHLLGLDEALDARRLILDRLHFDHDFPVQVFEVNIRLLGGLLSAYQLDGEKRFLELAQDLGRRLLPAFDSPTGMPYRFVNLKTGEASGGISNPAEIGTLTLELGTLGHLAPAKQAVTALFDRRSPLGLVGSRINVETGEWLDSRSHVGGGIDSYYEYLYKAWQLFGGADFLGMWKTSIAAVNRYAAQGVADMNTGKLLATRSGALQAFFPGLLALAGDTARAATAMDAIEAFGGLLPEAYDSASGEILAPAHELRPEVIESAWQLWRATGEERWRAFGLSYFDALERAARVEAGYAALADGRSGEKADRMHSFLFAETFKYAFLLAAPSGASIVDNTVMTTEAHPLRAG